MRIYDEKAKESANRTDEKHKGKILGFSTLSEDAINAIAPEPADKEKLSKLIEIVKSSTEDNIKITEIKKNFDNLADIMLNALKILLK